MKSPHLLKAANNVHRLRENLTNVLDAGGLAAIEAEILANVTQLYRLGRGHFLFAVRQNNRAWRQKVSRLYYAAYNASRAVRLCVNGEYSTEIADHKKIEHLPDDFPRRNTYANQLSVLREDRNLCDYDHTADSRDLILSIEDSQSLVTSFLADARAYLTKRGASL